ncbi:MAG: DUF2905 family protein [bacterium]|nr:DUF2905 family protein [bacterium]
MFSGMGKTLILLGAALIAAGVIVSFAPRIPFLGRLPGDLFYESKSGNVSFYFPIVTCLVISILLTILLNLFGGGR